MKICIIPARSGSRRIPHKNRKYFHGKPIIAYSIEAAKESGLFGNAIFVSTDDDEISKIAMNYGALSFHRSVELSQDSVGTQAVARAFLLERIHKMEQEKVCWAKPGEKIHHVCTLYATAPMVSPEDLQRGFSFLEHTKLQMVYSAKAVYDSLYSKAYAEDAGQWYFGTTAAVLAEVVPRDGNPGVSSFFIPSERVCDINVEADWSMAERMYAEMVSKRNA